MRVQRIMALAMMLTCLCALSAPAQEVTLEGTNFPISAYVLKIADHMEEEIRVTGEMNEGMPELSELEVKDGAAWKEIDAGPTLGSSDPVTESKPETEPADDYLAAWEQLKRLSGTWDSYLVGEEGRETIISYHVTGGDRVVFEEFLGDTPDGVRNMATAYHLDVDGLVATHYCGIGNQPRMRGASWDPDTKVLRFDFWDITDLPDPQAYYTTNIELYFEDDDNAELRFRGTAAGVQLDWQVHRMRRLTSRPYTRGPS